MEVMKSTTRNLVWIVLLLSKLIGCSAKTGAAPVDTANIGAMAGSIGKTFIEKTYPDAKLHTYDAITGAIEDLQKGELDYVITTYTTALYFVRNNDNLEILPDRLTNEGLQDNDFAGLDCELIERIAYELDRKAEVDMQFPALIEAVESGRVDVAISNLFPSEEKVDFTEEYFQNPQILLKRTES